MSLEVNGFGMPGFYNEKKSEAKTQEEEIASAFDEIKEQIDDYAKNELPEDLIMMGLEAIFNPEKSENNEKKENDNRKDEIIGGAIVVALGLFLGNKNKTENQENNQ